MAAFVVGSQREAAEAHDLCLAAEERIETANKEARGREQALRLEAVDR